MGLIDEARAATKKPGTQSSRIFRLIESLDGDERDEVITLVWERDPSISARAIGAVLTKHYGERFGEFTGSQVESHRRDRPRPE